MTAQLTERQAFILQWIKKFVAANGYPPTQAEIAHGFGFRSSNAAREHLAALQRKGLIEVDANIARGIRVVP